jgi:hypothetical protein
LFTAALLRKMTTVTDQWKDVEYAVKLSPAEPVVGSGYLRGRHRPFVLPPAL